MRWKTSSTPNPETKSEKGSRWLSRASLVVGAVLSLGIALLVWSDIKRDAVIVQPFVVPEQYEKDGYTKEVITRKIIDYVRSAENSVKIREQRTNDAIILSTDDDILTKLELPASKLSARTFVTLIRKVLGSEQRQLSGDVVLGGQCNKRNAANSGSATTVQVTIRLLPEHHNGSPTVVCLDNPSSEEDLIPATSRAVLRQMNPFTLAAYLGLTDHDFAASEALTNELINHANPEDRASLSKYYSLRGVLYFIANESDELAIADLKHAIILDRSAAGPHNNLGLVSLRQAEYSDAMAEFKRAIALDPSYSQAYSNLGLALELIDEQGNLDEAKANVEKAVELDPEFAVGYYYWGVILATEAGDPRKTSTRDVILNDALVKFGLAENAGLSDGRLYYMWGTTLESLGRSNEAITQFARAERQGYRDALLYLAWGDTLCRSENFAEAIAKYRKTEGPNASDYKVLDDLGTAFYNCGQWDEAKRFYQEAHKLDTRSAAGHFNLGTVLADKCAVQAAKIEFQKSLSLDPSFANANAYVRLGRVFIEEGSFGKALLQFKKARELDPENSYAYNYAGVAFQRQNKMAEAIDNFRKAVTLNPDSAEFHSNLSHALEVHGEAEEARREREKADQLGGQATETSCTVTAPK